MLRNRHQPTLGGENETLRVKNHHKSIENTAKYRQREQVYYLQIRHQVFGKQLYMRLGSVLAVTDTRDISGAEICSQIIASMCKKMIQNVRRNKVELYEFEGYESRTPLPNW
jgi:hypothetical protein